ncbi:hypothetical protein KSP40_PGU007306 [Platanthera guangdongensis]|uniref:Uncharacterized protein n=1 Tax=Platanthera guangdongensis TaxID=2320717 RepID=A0ABR2MMH9_9ASPA
MEICDEWILVGQTDVNPVPLILFDSHTTPMLSCETPPRKRCGKHAPPFRPSPEIRHPRPPHGSKHSAHTPAPTPSTPPVPPTSPSPPPAFTPDNFIFPAVIKSAGSLHDLAVGLQLHAASIKFGQSFSPVASPIL